MPNPRSEQVVFRARRLIPLLLALVMLAPAAGASKATPASAPGRPPAVRTTEVTRRDDAAAFRLLHKTERVTKHPEKATQAQLLRAAHDLALAAELAPDFELQPWFHADLGTVFYARAAAKQGAERTYLLEKSRTQFYLAALTHDLDADRGTARTNPRDVTDYEAAGDATASFILYHVALLNYELGDPAGALIPLHLLLAAADDHQLERPQYVQAARTLLVKAQQAEAKQKQRERPLPPRGSPVPGATH